MPPTQVEADKKVFHEDIKAEKAVNEVIAKAKKIAGKVEETGFIGGLAVGLAITLTWVTFGARRVY